VVVRDATPQELEAVGELTLAAYVDGEALADGDAGYPTALRDAALRAAQAQLLVATNPEGDLVGTVTVCRRSTAWSEIAVDGEAEIRMLAVDKRAWGRGVADALVADVVDRLRAEGLQRLVLVVLDGNEPALRLYRRLGFRRLPERDWAPRPGLVLRAHALDLGGRGAAQGL
jgi:ribosomal protein S18 acetylase RimI-like enzyme